MKQTNNNLCDYFFLKMLSSMDLSREIEMTQEDASYHIVSNIWSTPYESNELYQVG